VQEAVTKISSEIRQLKNRLRAASGGCRMFSQGEHCDCGLCERDKAIKRLRGVLTGRVVSKSFNISGTISGRFPEQKEKKMNLAELKTKKNRIEKQINLRERAETLEKSVEINVQVFKKGGGRTPIVFRFQNLNDIEQLKKLIHKLIETELQRLE